ncbi:MAG: resolvase [Actinobacteria bacterium]|nr:resolvase [Actinomycetota bacterium]
MGNAIGYTRVSTEQQAASGLGLEAQQQAISEAALRLGVVLVRTFTDELSGKLGFEDRPALSDALNAMKRGDVLIVARRDRLGRDVVNVALVERLVARRGGRVVSAAGEGNGDDVGALLQRRIIDAFSEHERLLIGQRTAAALKAKRDRGERNGNLPFGFRADGQTLVAHADEQLVLAVLRELRQEGLTLRAIAAELNRRGFTTRRGSAWRHQYVAALAA